MAGYKQFLAGDVVTASDIQSYLMDQTRPWFTNAAARTSSGMTGIGGVTSYTQSTGLDYGYFDAGAGTAGWYPANDYVLVGTMPLVTSTQNMSNVFSETIVAGSKYAYSHYRIELDLSGTAGQSVAMTLSVGGTPTTTGYTTYGRDLSPSGDAARTTSTTSFLAHHYLNAQVNRATIFLSNPALSSTIHSYFYFAYSNTQYTTCGGYLTAATSFDGFTLTATSAMSGNARVYGYRSY